MARSTSADVRSTRPLTTAPLDIRTVTEPLVPTTWLLVMMVPGRQKESAPASLSSFDGDYGRRGIADHVFERCGARQWMERCDSCRPAS